MGAICNGRVTTNDIVGFFDGKLGKDITFCVDSHKSYMKINDKLNVSLKRVPRGKSQHVNALHSGFKRWLTPFNGVSSNYLAWFKFLQLSKKNKKSDRIKDMLVNVATRETYITINTIRNRYIELA